MECTRQEHPKLDVGWRIKEFMSIAAIDEMAKSSYSLSMKWEFVAGLGILTAGMLQETTTASR
jgi:hypothetical protein